MENMRTHTFVGKSRISMEEGTTRHNLHWPISINTSQRPVPAVPTVVRGPRSQSPPPSAASQEKPYTAGATTCPTKSRNSSRHSKKMAQVNVNVVYTAHLPQETEGKGTKKSDHRTTGLLNLPGQPPRPSDRICLRGTPPWNGPGEECLIAGIRGPWSTFTLSRKIGKERNRPVILELHVDKPGPC